MTTKSTYEEGYRQGYEDAMSWVINTILDNVEGNRTETPIAEEGMERNDQGDHTEDSRVK